MKKLLGVAGLAIIAGMGMQTELHQVSRNMGKTASLQNSQTQPSPELPKLTQEQSTSKTFTNERKRGYSRLVYKNEGIDPKTYGMYHKKARTHKRTNV